MLSVNLNTKTVKRNGKTIVENGVPQNGYKISETPISFEDIDTLYAAYKHSVPNGMRRQRKFFRALPESELSTEDLITGENRQKAKERLEMAVLEGSLNGSLKWPDDTKWFWQSEKDPDLIILKKWIA